MSRIFKSGKASENENKKEEKKAYITRPWPRLGPRFRGTWSLLQVRVALTHCWHGNCPSHRIPEHQSVSMKSSVPSARGSRGQNSRDSTTRVAS